jgi:hypothetical protein
MKLLLLSASFLLAPAAPASAFNLLINGDFELPLATGWSTIAGDSVTIDRGTFYDPDPDFEAHIAQTTSTGEGALVQAIDLPGVDTEFSARMTCDASATFSAWAAAGIRLVYQTQWGIGLGETRIVACTRDCPWVSGPTMHLISAPENYWFEYSFNIAAELTNLPGVDPSCVRRIEVRVMTAMNNC